jgi:hypothetical protein
MKLALAILLACPALACTPLPARETCLTAEALAPVLAASLGMEGVSLEVLDHTRNPLPPGWAEFARADLASGGLWRGTWRYGEGRSMPIWARVRVRDRDGETLAEWRQAEAPEVLRGGVVRVEVRSGSVRIAFDALAESSGRRGEAVLIRNPENGQRLRAIVEAAGKVAIQK